MFSATTCRPSRVSRNSGTFWNEFVGSHPIGGGSLGCSLLLLKKPKKPPQRFADIHPNILSLTGPVPPQRRHGDGLGGQADRGHAAKPEGARNDRIAAVEG